MSLCEMTFYSEILQLDTCVYVILPQSEQGIGMEGTTREENKYPVLWLLHGRSDDHTIWMRRTSIERYVAPLGIAVVMPEVSYSRYLNMAHGPRYYDFMAEELPSLCRKVFPGLSSRREDNYIAGLSMGGGGAMYIGLKNPKQYSHIGMLSTGGAIPIENLWRGKNPNTRIYEDVYGVPNIDELVGGEYDLFVLARRILENEKELPRIYHAMGTEDERYPAAMAIKEFFEGLEGNPFGYSYHEGSGSHQWAFWDTWIQGFLKSLPLGKE